MKVRLRYGRESIAETPYKRFGYSYLLHLPKDGILPKSACSQQIKSEPSIGAISLSEKYGRNISDGCAICELGLGNFHSFRPYRNFIFTHDGLKRMSSALKSVETYSLFQIHLGEISAFQQIQLNIRDDAEYSSSPVSLKDFGIYFFTEFASYETLNYFNISISGNASHFWSFEPFSGALNLFTEPDSQIQYYLNFSFGEWTPVILNFNYDSYLQSGSYGRVEIFAWDDLVARWRSPQGAARGEINLTADVYKNTIIKITLKSSDGYGYFRIGKFVFANQNNPCIWR